MFQKINGRKLG